MKRFLKYVIVVLVLVIPVISLAFEFRHSDQISVNKEERITNDVYLIGGTVTSAGMIEGDLVAGGGNVVVSGDVSGDAMIGAGNVTILSNVGDDLRAGAGTLIIQGKIGGDAVLGGGQVNIGGEGVGGDLVVGAGNLNIDAPVLGDVLIAGGNVYINAPIEGNVKIEADKITLGSAAAISGDLDYKATKEIVREAGSVVVGKITFEQREKRASRETLGAALSVFIAWKFFTLLACALLFGLLFRRYSKEIVNLAKERPLFELGRGLLVFVAMPIISILLFVTLLGIPFGVLGLLGFVISMLFAWMVAPIILGSVAYKYFFKKDLEVSWKTILLGVFLYTVLGLVPFIGWLAQCLLMLLSLGCIVHFKWQIVKEWR